MTDEFEIICVVTTLRQYVSAGYHWQAKSIYQEACANGNKEKVVERILDTPILKRSLAEKIIEWDKEAAEDRQHEKRMS